MRKKFLSCLLIFIIVFVVPTGYQSAAPEDPPFSFDYESNEQTESFFLENDEFYTLFFGTPFYGGKEIAPIPQAIDFQKARIEKVEEIIGLSEKIVENADSMRERLDSVTEDLFSYLEIIADSDSELVEFDNVITSEIGLILARRELAEVHYLTLSDLQIDEPIIESFFDYTRVITTIDIAGSYIELLDSLGLYAGYCIALFEDHDIDKIRQAGVELDKNMLILDEMMDEVDILIESVESISYGIMQLAAADHHMAIASLDFIQGAIPELKELVEGLSPGDVLGLEDIEFISEYLDYYEDFALSLSEKLSDYEVEEIIATDMSNPGVAYAGGTDSYSQAMTSLEAPAKPEVQPGLLGRGWNALRNGGSAIASGVGSAVTTVGQTMRTGAGLLVETADATAFGVSRVATGIYYGNSSREIAGECFERLDTAVNRMIDYEMGADVYRTAGQYLDTAGDYVGEVAASVPGGIAAGLAIVSGELTGYDSRLTRAIDTSMEWSTWAARGLARTTAGFFTGLGSGIYQVANPESSTGDLINGTVRIGLSVIGGSKTMGTASEALGLAGRQGLTIARKGLGFISRALPARASSLLSHVGSSATSTAAAALNKVAPGLSSKLSRLITEGARKPFMQTAREYGQHIIGEAGNSLSGLFRHSYKGLPGLKEAIFDSVGRSLPEYSNNLAASWVDDFVRDRLSEGLEWMVTSDDSIEGHWDVIIRQVVGFNAGEERFGRRAVFYRNGTGTLFMGTYRFSAFAEALSEIDLYHEDGVIAGAAEAKVIVPDYLDSVSGLESECHFIIEVTGSVREDAEHGEIIVLSMSVTGPSALETQPTDEKGNQYERCVDFSTKTTLLTLTRRD